MGNETEFHFGKRRPQEGLEFVPEKKRASFRHAAPAIRDRSRFAAAQPEPTPEQAPSAQTEPYPEPYPEPQLDPLFQQAPPESLLPGEPMVPDPLDNIYQEPLLSAPQDEFQDDIDFSDAPAQEQDLKQDQATPLDPADASISLHDEPVQKSSKARKVLSYVTAFVAVILIVVSVLFLMKNTPNIPSSIRKKLAFQTYDFVKNGTFTLDKDSVQIDSQGNLIYFVDQNSNKAHFIISQQKIPDIVKNEANYKQFLADFDKYAETDTPIGKAYFTHPANIGSDVSAVIKTETTLLFIRGPGATSEKDWLEVLGSLKAAS